MLAGEIEFLKRFNQSLESLRMLQVGSLLAFHAVD
jgi:hypothetical protein